MKIKNHLKIIVLQLVTKPTGLCLLVLMALVFIITVAWKGHNAVSDTTVPSHSSATQMGMSSFETYKNQIIEKALKNL